MGKKNKKEIDKVERMTEEEYYGFDFIGGFTPGGVPYGITFEEAEGMQSTEQQLDKKLDYPF